MKNILICGDSFAIDYKKYNVEIPHKGWPNYLADKHNVTNLATPGVGQWKIWKQVESANLENFDIVLVSIGSPNRVHCRTHPVHKQGMFMESDLAWMDIDRSSWLNKALTTAKNWFVYFYDQQYQNELYEMITDKIINHIKHKKYILLGHNESRTLDTDSENFINCNDLWNNERGKVNHYNHKAALQIVKRIEKHL